jgi:hypothetical protein
MVPGEARRPIVAVAVAALALAVPAAAAGPGKRFAHNRGTWFAGAPPIEVFGNVSHPRSVSVRVEWRGKALPTGASAAAAVPDGGIGVTWTVNCPSADGNRAHRAKGTLRVTSSPAVRPLRLPRGHGPTCVVGATATGPSDESVGKILLDLYART